MVKKKMIAMLILLITYIVFVSGCMDKPGAEESKMSLEKLSIKMQEKENSINDSSYTLHVTAYSNGEKAHENEFNITCKKPNMKKTVTKQAGKETLMVSNGSVEWNYDPETNAVQKILISDEYQESEIDYLKFFNDTLNVYNVSLLGTEIIDGRNAYLFEAVPKTGGENQDNSIDKMKVWVDSEMWVPIKYEVYAGSEKAEIEIQNLKINTDISDSEFNFDVPEGANVTTMRFEDMFNKSFSEEGKMIPPEGENDTTLGVIV